MTTAPDLRLGHSRLPGRLGWLLVALSAAGVALVSAPRYLTLDPALNSIPLNSAFAAHLLWVSLHAVPAGLALPIGPLQFLPSVRARRPGLHRVSGRVYMLSVLVGAITSAVAAVMSTSGLAAQVGFLLLAAAWLWSGLQGYLTIRRGDVASHRVWMIRNYAFTFASVLLRLFLFAGLTVMGRAGEATSLTFGDVYTTSVWSSILVSYVVAEWFIVPRVGRSAKRASARTTSEPAAAPSQAARGRGSG